jgi:uncharacterized damage-inducible protein DinB
LPVKTTSELLELHDASSSELQAALGRTDHATLSKQWTLRRASVVLFSAPRCVTLRTVVMSHIIHHRAQMGVYLRLLGVPVPGMYGPSADDTARRNAA